MHWNVCCSVGGFFVFNFSDLLGRILAGIAKWPKATRLVFLVLLIVELLVDNRPLSRIASLFSYSNSTVSWWKLSYIVRGWLNPFILFFLLWRIILILIFLRHVFNKILRGGSWLTLLSSLIRLAFIPLFMVWSKKK